MHKNNYSYLHQFVDLKQFDYLTSLLINKEIKYKQNLNYQDKININQNGFYKKANYKNYSQDIITIGNKDELNNKELIELKKNLKEFIPWRKGPFSIFGTLIDSEWQSHKKWNRLLPYLNKMENKIICDIGCNNGYYMYKIAHHRPKLVLGIDPTYSFKLIFDYLQKFTQEENLKYELMGFQELTSFEQVFDIIFCMGIVYHHKNPIDILNICKRALKPGGQLILESMSIPGDEAFAFCPEGRYANVSGIWFIPTYKCIYHWLKKTGYASIHRCSHYQMKESEQRTTKWAPYPSFAESLDPINNSMTKEGFLRPYRTIYICTKK